MKEIGWLLATQVNRNVIVGKREPHHIDCPSADRVTSCVEISYLPDPFMSFMVSEVGDHLPTKSTSFGLVRVNVNSDHSKPLLRHAVGQRSGTTNPYALGQ